MTEFPDPHPPDPDTPDLKAAATRFMTSIWRLHRDLGHELGPLLAEGAHTDPRTYFLLNTIRDGAHYPKTLSECLGIPPNLLSRLLTELHTQALITRQVDTQDSRRVRLTVTPEGQALLDRAEAIMHDRLGARLRQLSPNELSVLLTALDRLSSPETPPTCTGPHP